MKKSVVVLGLGNPLMADEGVGVRLLEQLAGRADKYPSVEFIDAGTEGMAILHHLAGRQKAIILDCASMGTKPGTIRRFNPEQVETVKVLNHYSLHEIDVLKVIDLSSRLGQRPEEIVFFGIEPERVEPAQTLSQTITIRMDGYIKAILKELET